MFSFVFYVFSMVLQCFQFALQSPCMSISKESNSELIIEKMVEGQIRMATPICKSKCIAQWLRRTAFAVQYEFLFWCVCVGEVRRCIAAMSIAFRQCRQWRWLSGLLKGADHDSVALALVGAIPQTWGHHLSSACISNCHLHTGRSHGMCFPGHFVSWCSIQILKVEVYAICFPLEPYSC